MTTTPPSSCSPDNSSADAAAYGQGPSAASADASYAQPADSQAVYTQQPAYSEPSYTDSSAYAQPGYTDSTTYAQQAAYSQGTYTDPSSQGYQARQSAPSTASTYPAYGAAQKSKVAAGLLGIFLGTLGVHNFYLGHTVKGVIQLLITVLSLGFLSWVSWIWGLVEAVLILTAQPGAHPWGVDARGIPLNG